MFGFATFLFFYDINRPCKAKKLVALQEFLNNNFLG